MGGCLCCKNPESSKVQEDDITQNGEEVGVKDLGVKQPSLQHSVPEFTIGDHATPPCEADINAPLQLALHTTNDIPEPTISDLKLGDIDKLSVRLDPKDSPGIRNWEHLATKFYQKKLEMPVERKQQYISKIISDCKTRGNPTLKFLEKLHQIRPKLTIKQFSDVGKNLDRDDIADLLNENVESPLKDIGFEIKQDLCTKLNEELGAGIKNWKHFADKFGFRSDEIKYMSSMEKQKEKDGPTECFIRLLQEFDPYLELKELQEMCENISRGDVAGILDNIIKKIKKEKVNANKVF